MKNFDSKLQGLIFKKHNIELDSIQRDLVLSITDMLVESFFISKVKKVLLKKKEGIYLYGKVGRGKSLLCQSINALLLRKSKMENFNSLIFKLQKYNLPVSENTLSEKILNDLLLNTQMLIIDELQLDNIADVHIFYKFIKLIKKKKIFVIFTSNKAPSSLYRSVKEDSFIKEFKNFFNKNYYLLKNETNQDYRLSNRLGNHFFFFTESQNELKQNNLVKQITKNSVVKYHNVEDGLNLKFRINRKFKLIDCNFFEMCSTNLGNNEYKVICQSFKFIIIRNIPILDEEKKDLIARFILLIDNIYDGKIFLSISSKFKLNEIFRAKTKKFEFERTLSRLIEMGSQKYISKIL